MTKDTKRKLRAAGWKVGTTKEFLGLSKEDEAFVGRSVARAKAILPDPLHRRVAQRRAVRRSHDSKDLVPIATFNANASEMIRRLRRRNKPFLITRNGRVVAALLSLEQFDRMVGETKLVAAVREGLDDSQAGRVIPDDNLDPEERSARR